MKKLNLKFISKTHAGNLLLLLGLSALTLCFLCSCSSSPEEIRNVILISIDTCRADHLGCYGYHKDTTPNIDKIAREGIIFKNAYSEVPITLPSHSSMLTGTIPPYHGVHDNAGYYLAQSNLTLAEILEQNGFTTGAAISAYVLSSKFGLKQGFSTYGDLTNTASGASDIIERRGEETNRFVLKWLEKHKNKRFFLFLHYFDPHQAYEPPEPFASRFAGNAYAGEIAYTDFCIGQVVARLKALKLYDSSLIIITSDHGEMLNEHGEMSHAYFIYQSALKVPLIFKLPGSYPVAEFDEPVGLIDIVPTVCSMLGIRPDSSMQGKDLSPCFFGKIQPSPDRKLYCESLYPTKYGANSLLGIITDRWKFIQTTRPELYDLKSDPDETNNVYKQQPKRARILREHLRLILEDTVQANNTSSKGTLEIDDLNRLESLGYVASSGVNEDFSFNQNKKDPKDMIGLHSVHSKGLGLIDDNQLMEAAALYEKAIKAYPQDPESLLYLGIIKQKQGDLPAAARFMKKSLQSNPDYFRANLNMGCVLTGLGRNDEALQYFISALKINPGSFDAHHNAGYIFLNKGKLDEALRHYKEALKCDPDSALAHNNMGIILSGKGDNKAALSHFNDAIGLDPEYANPYQNSAEILRQQGNLKAAIANYRKALMLEPNSPEVLLNLEKTHLMLGNKLAGGGAYTEATAHFQHALQINNNSAEAHTNLGYALLVLGREDEAIKHCLEAIRIDPEKSVNAFYNLACIYAKRNEKEESVKWLKMAVEKGFNDWETLRTDEDLKNIRNADYYKNMMSRD